MPRSYFKFFILLSLYFILSVSSLASQDSLRVDINSIKRGSIPDKYVIVTCRVVFDNRSKKEVKIETGDVYLIDENDKEYYAYFVPPGKGYEGFGGGWGYSYPSPLYSTSAYIKPYSSIRLGAAFYLPKGKSPKMIIVRHKGKELERSLVY